MLSVFSFHGDGYLLAGVGDGTVRVWSTRDWAPAATGGMMMMMMMMIMMMIMMIIMMMIMMMMMMIMMVMMMMMIGGDDIDISRAFDPLLYENG